MDKNGNGLLTIALPKGRLADSTYGLFVEAQIQCPDPTEAGRKLILTDEELGIRLILAKPTDVPTYVEYGVADMGVVGLDTLLEAERNLLEVLDLGIGRCALCLCGDPKLLDVWPSLPHKRIGSKYPRYTERYFIEQMRESVEVIYLNGSVELAPLLNLTDMIVDIVESGQTLRENGLVVLRELTPVSARLVVNQASMRIKQERINGIISALSAVVK
ncbi:MAG: ATP phosphoribosyltransferase [Clostridiaceae bacterium]|nr:ATP phosphoribosyltransferase [Clostridiaceae bacterium]